MNLARLRCFVAVAEELHFGRAAVRLHMAQPPLSRQIRQLEREVGSDLFERTTRRVELSGAGRALFPEARRLVRDADAFDRLIAEQRSGRVGVLRLGFVDSASYEVMPRLVQAYRERWPGVTFELRTLSSEAQRQALPMGEIDLGIARTRGGDVGLSDTRIITERLFVAASEGHRLVGPSRDDRGHSEAGLRLRELAGESFISFSRVQSPALTGELRAMLEGAGVDYDPIIEAEEYTTILGLVAAGEGIAVVPEAVLSFRPPGIVYVAISDAEATTELMLLTRNDEPLIAVRRALELANELFD